MGYKGNNDRGKEENRACGKACWFSRQKITKQIVSENRCNDISFRPDFVKILFNIFSLL